MESKNTKPSEQNTTKYLVSYKMRAVQGKFHGAVETTQVVEGDLEPWYKQLCFDNPEYDVVVTVACLIW